jgi:hypothetical protein
MHAPRRRERRGAVCRRRRRNGFRSRSSCCPLFPFRSPIGSADRLHMGIPGCFLGRLQRRDAPSSRSSVLLLPRLEGTRLVS